MRNERREGKIFHLRASSFARAKIAVIKYNFHTPRCLHRARSFVSAPFRREILLGGNVEIWGFNALHLGAGARGTLSRELFVTRIARRPKRVRGHCERHTSLKSRTDLADAFFMSASVDVQRPRARNSLFLATPAD